MSNAIEFSDLVADPGLMVDLFRKVLEQSGVHVDNLSSGNREVQLIEISKAIERLQKIGAGVPDSLIAEKLRLAMAYEIPSDVAIILEPVVMELLDLLGKIRSHLPSRRLRDRSEDDAFVNERRQKITSNDFDVSIIANPRELRRQSGMNQSAFWTRFGVTQSGGSRYESGRSIPGPTQILMMLYAKNVINDEDLHEMQKALGPNYKPTAE